MSDEQTPKPPKPKHAGGRPKGVTKAVMEARKQAKRQAEVREEVQKHVEATGGRVDPEVARRLVEEPTYRIEYVANILARTKICVRDALAGIKTLNDLDPRVQSGAPHESVTFNFVDNGRSLTPQEPEKVADVIPITAQTSNRNGG